MRGKEMTPRQSEVLFQIQKRHDERGKGTYIDRHNSRAVYALAEMGLVVIHPYTMEFGNVAFPAPKHFPR